MRTVQRQGAGTYRVTHYFFRGGSTMRPAGRVNDFLGIVVVFVLAVGVCIPSSEAYGQSGPVLLPYQATDDWARLPRGRIWGAPTGVEMDPDQESVWVLERCGDFNGPGCADSEVPPILKFDSSGTLVQSFGAGMFLYPLSANVRETRSTQRIRVGRRQRKRTCWDCEREWKRMVVPLEPGRPSEARQLLRTRR